MLLKCPGSPGGGPRPRREQWLCSTEAGTAPWDGTCSSSSACREPQLCSHHTPSWNSQGRETSGAILSRSRCCKKQLHHLASSEPGFSAVLQWGSLSSELGAAAGPWQSPQPIPQTRAAMDGVLPGQQHHGNSIQRDPAPSSSTAAGMDKSGFFS